MSTQLEKLSRLANGKNQAELDAKKRIEDQLQERLAVIQTMGPRIDDAIAIGEILEKNGLLHIDGDASLRSTEYDDYIGFVGPTFGVCCWCGYSIYGIGIGRHDFYIKGTPSFGGFLNDAPEKKVKLLDRFIAGFPEFEERLHRYVDSIEEL